MQAWYNGIIIQGYTIMAFRSDSVQQISIDDTFNNASPRVQRIVEKSWAKVFADHVYPAINGERFRVLYSDNEASRPGTSVKYVIGALLIKELFGLTDDEAVEMCICDIRAQYALHSTSLQEQPISDRTFSRFRERLYNYEQETGVDLLKEEMKSLADVFARYLKISGSTKRMDSLMIASHCKSMSRLEILYTCVFNCVKLLKRTGNELMIPKEMAHYLEKDDVNQVIYYSKAEELEPRLQTVINEAILMKKLMEDDEWHSFSEYQLLIRVLNEQTKEDGKPKEKKEITSTSLQNPSDPDATYRKKAGKDHKGYVGNLVESIGENGAGIITDFSYDQNTHSDQEYTEEYIANNSGNTIIADGAYGSVELQNKAKEKGINLVTTALTGKEPEDITADFELNEDGTAVVKCPKEHCPVESTYYESNGMIRAKFNKADCQHCPFRNQCKAKFQKQYAVVMVSSKMKARAEYLRLLGSEEYKTLTRQRNAIEGVPSVLRRRYHVDDIPVFGKKRSKIFFYLKVGAFNVAKLIHHIPKATEYSLQMAW